MLLGVDVGGTFTDAVLVDEDSAVHTAKVSSTPAEQSLAVLDAVRLVLARAGVEGRRLQRFAHGMTVATNALLEGRTARTALIATDGFTDVIELGRQARPRLYELCAAAPAPLVPAPLRFGAPERAVPGGVERALERAPARRLVEEVAAAAPQAVAVSLLHSYAHPRHERLLGELLGELLPGVPVSLSSELVGTFREYERTATTALDAALSPLLGTYLKRLSAEAAAGSLPEPLIMQSSGGLADCDHAAAHAALTVLSGPAGGVGGALLLAGLAGAGEVLCFDMGGTSCDVCVIDGGQVAETAERMIAGRPVSLPALDIHTVGAGGGSIAWRDAGGALRVGPHSAGAVPGPACYGRGGTEPTVTDANLLLGRLLEDVPLADGLELDRAAAERAVSPLARELGMDVPACAEGIVRVAEAEMLAALRLMTVERGIDPRHFALMPFGGAGPLHAAALAAELGIERILCPRTSGVLCALGLAAAPPRRDVSLTVLLSGASLTRERLREEREALLAQAAAALGSPPARVRVRHELRYRGQSFELSVDEPPGADPTGADPGGADPDGLRESFARAHERRYGYRDERAEVELVNIRVSAWGPAPPLRPLARPGGGPGPGGGPAGGGDSAGGGGSAGAGGPAGAGEASTAGGERCTLILDGAGVQAQLYRGEPDPGTTLRGPALCSLGQATLLVPDGWSGEVDAHGTIHLRREA